MIRSLEKIYPGSYDLTTMVEYHIAMVKKRYSHLLIPFDELYLLSEDPWDPDTNWEKDRLVSTFYYVVKDVEQNTVYYGLEQKKLERWATSRAEVVLRTTLKSMSRYYGCGWQGSTNQGAINTRRD